MIIDEGDYLAYHSFEHFSLGDVSLTLPYFCILIQIILPEWQLTVPLV